MNPLKFEKTKLKKTCKDKEVVRFMPNFGHIKTAIKQLPSASTHDNDTISTFIRVDNKLKEIAFIKKRIQRGSKEVFRWVYEGKFLIREQDIKHLLD